MSQKVFLVMIGLLMCVVSNPMMNSNLFAKGSIPSKSHLLDGMSKIDQGRHSAKQFESVVNVIKRYFPEGVESHPPEETYFDICFFLNESHARVVEVIPDLGLYEFVLGFKNFVRDGNSNNSFLEALAIYTTKKMYGY